MRITGGRARSILLKVPDRRQLRPATERMREAVFSHLGDRIIGARFLDVFAGTGAYGLEALSRGAKSGVFVEKDRRTAAALQSNLTAIAKSLNEAKLDCKLIESDIWRWKAPLTERFDFVFADPPYGITARHTEALFALFHRCLADQPSARLIFEMPGTLNPCPPPWKVEHRLGHRDTAAPSVLIYRF